MESVDSKKIDGKVLAKKIREQVSENTDRLREMGITPKLVSLAVDDGDPSFASYMRSRDRACKKVGIDAELESVPLKDAERSLAKAMARLSDSPDVHGILLNMPLPSGVNEETVLAQLHPKKDIEGITPDNAGLLALGRPRYSPCTAAAVMELIRHEEIELEGRHVVVLGRSKVVGGPLSTMLLHKSTGGNGTVTVCHSRTRSLPSMVSQADVVIAAIGQPQFVKGTWLRQGAVVIDVGTHAVEDPESKTGWRMVGDVDYDSAEPIASRITPVPGGVGPVTTAILLRACARAAAESKV